MAQRHSHLYRSALRSADLRAKAIDQLVHPKASIGISTLINHLAAGNTALVYIANANATSCRIAIEREHSGLLMDNDNLRVGMSPFCPTTPVGGILYDYQEVLNVDNSKVPAFRNLIRTLPVEFGKLPNRIPSEDQDDPAAIVLLKGFVIGPDGQDLLQATGKRIRHAEPSVRLIKYVEDPIEVELARTNASTFALSIQPFCIAK